MPRRTPSPAAVCRRGTAIAHPNIALIKYWGKRPGPGNLPAVPSLSLTLGGMRTVTQVTFDPASRADAASLNGCRLSGGPLAHVQRVLDLLRAAAGCDDGALVTSDNDFPTAAGLASSASGFAALTVAAARALALDWQPTALSAVARVGSGSAARSLFGGIVEMQVGVAADGHDAVARPLCAAADWPLEVVVAICSDAVKPVSSSVGMERSRLSSPFYSAWVASAEADLEAARAACLTRDFAGLAEVAEHSGMKMHGLALSSRPPLLYWLPATVACIAVVAQLRQDGVPTFVTIDAGPQVKAICAPGAGAAVAAALSVVPGVLRTLQVPLGDGARATPSVSRAAS